MVPLGEVARDVLRDQVRRVKSPHVFLDTMGEPYTTVRHRNRISQRTRVAAKAAGLRSSFKAIRTTVATWLARAGESDLAIGKLLGHAWIRGHVTGKHYIKMEAEDLRATIRELDRLSMFPTPFGASRP